MALYFRAAAVFAVGLLVGLFVASPFIPYAGALSPYDEAHMHSPAAADNGRDYSTLSGYAGTPDNLICVYDETPNNVSYAVGRAFDNGALVGRVQDSGLGGECNPVGRNAASHDACNGLTFGCGPNSRHGT